MTLHDPRTVRILLLDDDPFMQKILTLQLAQCGYGNVIACGTGANALQNLSARDAAVDLIFLDINMPGMDGVEFIRRLAGCQFGGSIVLVSGESGRLIESVEKLIQVHKLKALGRLRKPVKTAELAAVLNQVQPHASLAQPLRRSGKDYSVEEFRAAIANQELINHYQPKVSLATGEVVGVECLVRWQHSTDGLIYPDRFIDLATQHGLLVEITHAVLPAAMRQAKAWRQAGYHLPVSVNVSMDDLTALDFPDFAAALAGSIGIDPNLVTLEVTEGQVMKDRGAVLEVLSRLQLKRFRLSIDDFGTGHSSLAQLRDLPFDELKVDRSFVHGATADSTRRAICNASLRMAQQLKLTVVAEGIEDRADWELLQDMGCEIGQGYFIAQPMPPASVLGWINSWDSDARWGASNPLTA